MTTTTTLPPSPPSASPFATPLLDSYSPRLKYGILGAFLAQAVLALVSNGLVATLVVLIAQGSLLKCYEATEAILSLDEGPIEMQAISNAIREGSLSYFMRVYGTIGRLSLPVALAIFVLYAFLRPAVPASSTGASDYDVPPGDLFMAFVTSLTFLVGCACSSFAGFVGLWASTQVNVRTAAAALNTVKSPGKGTPHPIHVALKGGAIPAVVVVALVILGVSTLFSFLSLVTSSAAAVPNMMIGFGFGASFVALFAQLGGGIFTKAADVGADLVGKLEANIPEDDDRNPAVIADLVGDNVGDCAARGADLFESIGAEIISSMILGNALARTAGNHQLTPSEAVNFVMFPLVVHAFDLVVSGVGLFAALRSTRGATAEVEPIEILKRGHRVALGASLVGLLIATRTMLYVEALPLAWMWFFGCSVVGCLTGFASIKIAEYYTDIPNAPVQSIGRASENGHATNVIAGLSVGFVSTGACSVVIGLAVSASYSLGQASGLKDANSGEMVGGLYGTAVATMGALSSAAYVLSMDMFGPISDNAGGITEMSGQTEDVRRLSDKLDAVGNSTKAATKTFALTTAALASFLLVRAFMDEVASYSGRPFDSVDVTKPYVFVAGLAGGALVFVFAGMAISAVGTAADCVVAEVRRQFREIPGIMDRLAKPEYGNCVDIVARESLKLMIAPGLLAISSPLLVGLAAKAVYGAGAEALVGFQISATIVGVLLGLFLSFAGGAWDNTKKAVEMGAFGGKGSKAHRAAITGDVVGDPLKDTAGPSLHVVIKLISTVVLVGAPFFV